ncbi:Zinc finger, C2H2 domain-containing protein [Rozella allomycis CSF55]|uniref:Zinc finger, C2H2 domain-containing protein n=1 Tax=Rozella allomycis (strain CSF55) TaxID=988480 RepID=A0A075AZZ6_ROZAC|nr:Zinc finger, C2H2 domain-containing protein [Rozella allomycis CSF55]|eukprot:EPZ34094.1 Zinc finger, C2H2 domain-containing protein [Rozella allomycis CSF55]
MLLFMIMKSIIVVMKNLTALMLMSVRSLKDNPALMECLSPVMSKGILQIVKETDKYLCPFPGCSEEFTTISGIKYHVINYQHSLKKITMAAGKVIAEDVVREIPKVVSLRDFVYAIDIDSFHLLWSACVRNDLCEMEFEIDESNETQKKKKRSDRKPLKDYEIVDLGYLEHENLNYSDFDEIPFDKVLEFALQPLTNNFHVNKDYEIPHLSLQDFKNFTLINTGGAIISTDVLKLGKGNCLSLRDDQVLFAVGGYKDPKTVHTTISILNVSKECILIYSIKKKKIELFKLICYEHESLKDLQLKRIGKDKIGLIGIFGNQIRLAILNLNDERKYLMWPRQHLKINHKFQFHSFDWIPNLSLNNICNSYVAVGTNEGTFTL